MRVLAERRVHLMQLARLAAVTPRDLREFTALTWSLRLLRTIYGDLDAVTDDLTYRLPRLDDGEASPPEAQASTLTDELTHREEPEP